MRLLTFSFIKNCKSKQLCIGFPRKISGNVQPNIVPVTNDPSLVVISPTWKEDVETEMRRAVVQDMQVYPDFITEQEENALLEELEPVLRRMRYEFDHWDNAIQGFRETERSSWSAHNAAVLNRVRARAFGSGASAARALAHVHVLDLAAAGHIKPHIDAVRFCGDVIAGLCLASSAVMRLQHSDRPLLALHALLARRALYIMKGVARYSFTHAVLGGEHSAWGGARVPRGRRVALICRSAPPPRGAAGGAGGHTDAVPE